MTEYLPSPAEQLERHLDYLSRELDELSLDHQVGFLVSRLDDLCAKARNPETQDMIAGEAIGIGQARTRCELILSFLETRKPNTFRIIRNG